MVLAIKKYKSSYYIKRMDPPKDNALPLNVYVISIQFSLVWDDSGLLVSTINTSQM